MNDLMTNATITIYLAASIGFFTLALFRVQEHEWLLLAMDFGLCAWSLAAAVIKLQEIDR
jgi:hypothetical protein